MKGSKGTKTGRFQSFGFKEEALCPQRRREVPGGGERNGAPRLTMPGDELKGGSGEVRERRRELTNDAHGGICDEVGAISSSASPRGAVKAA